MSNWSDAARRGSARGSRPDGRLFIHVFTHRSQPYRFDHGDKADWIAQHFFTGGIMPSHGLIGHFPDLFAVEQEWRWSGAHYQRTALDWLANFDANRTADRCDPGRGLRRRRRSVAAALAAVLPRDGRAVRPRGGEEWGVSHYRLRPT